MNARDVLRETHFGEDIAENEAESLEAYFVETEQWKEIFAGKVDVVYGVKGSGKSALYILLSKRSAELGKRKILAIQAENPRGAPVFQDLVADPPTSENEFRVLWKLYVLAIIGQRFQDADIKDPKAKRVVATLVESNLLTPSSTLKAMLKAALHYAREVIRAESIEGGIGISPTTGLPTITGKITFREPPADMKTRGFISVDELLSVADEVLVAGKAHVWILLDRLDVAFSETEDLEANALRALFRVYRDLGQLTSIRFKIFIRSDIWRRITQERGFREASHIARQTTITWNKNGLLNLVILRLLRNRSIQEFYNVDASTLNNIESQLALFYRVFPRQIDVGSRKLETWDWMLGRTSDGSKENAPRELLQLLRITREFQLRRWEVGEAHPEGEELFDRSTFKDALLEVSRIRLERTLLAEYPKLRKPILALEGEKTLQTPQSLSALWEVPTPEAQKVAGRLVEIGFFEPRGSKADPQYWVPFLYRGALKMVQGAAEVEE